MPPFEMAMARNNQGERHGVPQAGKLWATVQLGAVAGRVS